MPSDVRKKPMDGCQGAHRLHLIGPRHAQAGVLGCRQAHQPVASHHIIHQLDAALLAHGQRDGGLWIDDQAPQWQDGQLLRQVDGGAFLFQLIADGYFDACWRRLHVIENHIPIAHQVNPLSRLVSRRVPCLTLHTDAQKWYQRSPAASNYDEFLRLVDDGGFKRPAFAPGDLPLSPLGVQWMQG